MSKINTDGPSPPEETVEASPTMEYGIALFKDGEGKIGMFDLSQEGSGAERPLKDDEAMALMNEGLERVRMQRVMKVIKVTLGAMPKPSGSTAGKIVGTDGKVIGDA